MCGLLSVQRVQKSRVVTVGDRLRSIPSSSVGGQSIYSLSGEIDRSGTHRSVGTYLIQNGRTLNGRSEFAIENLRGFVIRVV